MERVKISFPEKMEFSIVEKIRVGDLNYGNHLGNDSVLSLVHQARIEFFHQFGWTEMNVEAVGLIMADSAIQYKSEGFLGERIRIFVGFGKISRVGFELYFKLVKEADGTVLANARTGMVCFDYKTKKLSPVPGNAVKIIEKHSL
jgi:acyl-CoA thioester hydrolase